MLNPDTWRVLLRVVAALLLVFGLAPSLQYEGGTIRTAEERDYVIAHPDAQPTRTDFTLGWRSSPVLRYFRESTLSVEKDGTVRGGRSEGMLIGWLTWSMVSIVAGCVLFNATRKRTPSTPEPEQPALRESAGGGIG